MIWVVMGIGLLAWSLYEFVNGTTWTYRIVYRKYEPGLFWVVSIFWFLLSLTLIVPAVGYYF